MQEYRDRLIQKCHKTPFASFFFSHLSFLLSHYFISLYHHPSCINDKSGHCLALLLALWTKRNLWPLYYCGNCGRQCYRRELCWGYNEKQRFKQEAVHTGVIKGLGQDCPGLEPWPYHFLTVHPRASYLNAGNWLNPRSISFLLKRKIITVPISYSYLQALKYVA